jgi:hypothetical protein
MTKTETASVAIPLNHRLGADKKAVLQLGDGAFLAQMALQSFGATPEKLGLAAAIPDGLAVLPEPEPRLPAKVTAVPAIARNQAGSEPAPDALPDTTPEAILVSDATEAALSDRHAPEIPAPVAVEVFTFENPIEPVEIGWPISMRQSSKVVDQRQMQDLTGHPPRENAFYLRSAAISDTLPIIDMQEGPNLLLQTAELKNRADMPIQPEPPKLEPQGHGSWSIQPQLLHQVMASRPKAARIEVAEHTEAVATTPVNDPGLPRATADQAIPASTAVHHIEKRAKGVEALTQMPTDSAISNALPSVDDERPPKTKAAVPVLHADPNTHAIAYYQPDTAAKIVPQVALKMGANAGTIPQSTKGGDMPQRVPTAAQDAVQPTPANSTKDVPPEQPQGLYTEPRAADKAAAEHGVQITDEGPFQTIKAAIGKDSQNEIALPVPKPEQPQASAPHPQHYQQSPFKAAAIPPRIGMQMPPVPTQKVTEAQVLRVPQDAVGDEPSLRFISHPPIGATLLETLETVTPKGSTTLPDAATVPASSGREPTAHRTQSDVTRPNNVDGAALTAAGFAKQGNESLQIARPDAMAQITLAPGQPVLNAMALTAPLDIGATSKIAQTPPDMLEQKEGFVLEPSKHTPIRESLPYGDRMFALAGKPNPAPALGAAPATISPTTALVSALPHHIRTLAAADKPQSLELSLTPEELGKLRILFTPDGDKIRVVIQAERPETLELLRRNADNLSADLRQSGYSGTSFSFASWGDAPQARPNTKHTTNAEGFEPKDKALPKTRPGGTSLRGSGLDLRV